METAIWVIGLIAAVVIIIIYVITSVNKYSNSFVGKYFDEEKKGKYSGNDLTKDTDQSSPDEKVNLNDSDIKSDQK